MYLNQSFRLRSRNTNLSLDGVILVFRRRVLGSRLVEIPDGPGTAVPRFSLRRTPGSGSMSYSSAHTTTRGIGGEGAQDPRLSQGLSLMLSLVLAAGLGTALLAVLPGGQETEYATAPAEELSLACTRAVDPTTDLTGVLASLRPGQVACLRTGTYGARGTRADWESSGTAEEPIVVRAAGDGPVVVHGFLNIEADHAVIDGLVFDGPTGAVHPENTPAGEEVLVWAQGDHIRLSRCEVRNGLWRAGIYVTGRDVRIDACWVHDIGPWSDPEQMQAGGRADNIDHGVYWGRGSTGSLTNSVLEHNLAYGLQISGGAGEVLVANNTIVRNGTGGVIWAEETDGSSLINNIIAFNDGYGVNAHLLEGERNVARNNLAWGNARGEWNDNGPLTTRMNGVSDPLFVGPRDYRLRRSSPAVDAGARTGAPAVDRDGVRRPQGAGADIGAYELPYAP